MAFLKFFRKSLGESNGRKLFIERIFSIPKTSGDLLKQLIFFIVYFWPTIYFVCTGELLFRLN